MVDVNYSLTGANGDTITFDYQSYVLNPEFAGFGIPPAQVRIEPSAGDGGVYRHSKKGIRDIDIPVTVFGADRAEVQTKLRRLSRLVQDSAGPTTIRANYSNGDTLSLQGHYVGGAESVWGSDAGLIWNRWVLSFQCPQPFWESGTQETFEINTEGTGNGLWPQLTKLKLRSAEVFGVIDVNNQGDVPAYPIWTFTGPINNVSVISGTRSFSFSTDISAGEVITVDTESGTVTDQDGVNRYAYLGTAPKLFRIEPGESVITINGAPQTGAAEVELTYSPRFEVVH